jgi:hypothetical protein
VEILYTETQAPTITAASRDMNMADRRKKFLRNAGAAASAAALVSAAVFVGTPKFSPSNTTSHTPGKTVREVNTTIPTTLDAYIPSKSAYSSSPCSGTAWDIRECYFSHFPPA